MKSLLAFLVLSIATFAANADCVHFDGVYKGRDSGMILTIEQSKCDSVTFTENHQEPIKYTLDNKFYDDAGVGATRNLQFYSAKINGKFLETKYAIYESPTSHNIADIVVRSYEMNDDKNLVIRVSEIQGIETTTLPAETFDRLMEL